MSAGELTFLEMNARQEGITVEVAAERYGWHEAFSQLVAELWEAYPGDYAGSMIEPVESAVAWVAFRDRAPQPAVDLLQTFPHPVAVYEHRGFTETELDERVVKVHYAVRDQKDVVGEVASGYDIETGEITVIVEPVTGIDHTTVGRQLNELLSASAGPAVTIESLSNTHVAQFRTGSGISNVTGTGTATRGQRLCRYGQTTGGHCDDVSRWLNECEGRACRLVAMERYTSAGGDSGGPYFSGTTAYGIHYGWK